MNPDVIIVAGVTASGKSVLGAKLARKLSRTFVEADDFHSAESIQKMSSGQPLNDADRAPWLDRLNDELIKKRPAVVACSALKQEYRDALTRNLSSHFIWLNVPPRLIAQRLGRRKNHFMPASLMESQFAIAEPPEDALILDGSRPMNKLVAQCVEFYST